MAERSKFDELRAKTERQLIELINSELDLGVREAGQALSADTCAFAEGHHATAQRAYARAARLILLVGESRGDQRGLEERLKRLRGVLDGLSVLGATPTPTRETVPRFTLKSQRASHAVCC